METVWTAFIWAFRILSKMAARSWIITPPWPLVVYSCAFCSIWILFYFMAVFHYILYENEMKLNYKNWQLIFMPRHQKVAGYYVIPSEILSVRPSVRLSICLSVRPSVRPSAPTTILVSATPPTVLGQSFWNFTGVLRMVWRYAYCFFRILKLFFITFFPFLT